MAKLKFITDAEDILFDIDRHDAEERESGVIGPGAMALIRLMYFEFNRDAEEIARVSRFDLSKIREVIAQSTSAAIETASTSEDNGYQRASVTKPGFITDAEDMLFDMDRMDAEDKAAGIIRPHKKDSIRHMHFGFNRTADQIARSLELEVTKVQEVIDLSTPEEIAVWR
ncbi:hypothetical protein [Rhizobium sp. BK176]|uniref:hypothetical protein n=1 Tax=Rhizobium sp. BK176 TaxID=2587071 RepID=UPI00216A5D25|nr:hypothetical protein [Rhizobium sp. BK176]MCS4089226.1 hypothetical protein [Rhizobium sp. BK176]